MTRGLKKKHNFCDMLSRDYNALYDFLDFIDHYIVGLTQKNARTRVPLSKLLARGSAYVYLSVCSSL